MLVYRRKFFKRKIIWCLRSQKILKFLSFFIFKKRNKESFKNAWKSYFNHNRILLIDKNEKRKFVHSYPGLKIYFQGKGAKVILHTPIHFNNSVFHLCDNTQIVIQRTPYSLTLITSLRKNCSVNIGENFYCNYTEIETFATEGKSVHIGNNCKFSWDVTIWTSDGHTILDESHKNILNKSSDGVYIGNHVWLCHGVHILKGSKISDNSVVGIHSIVTKKFEKKNSLIIGQPAKVVKTNIDWDRLDITEFEQKIN